jgi:hypothetical protein
MTCLWITRSVRVWAREMPDIGQSPHRGLRRCTGFARVKPPLEPPITVTTKEALRLLSVSRSRFHQWRTTGLISVYCYNGNRPLYLRADVVALLDRLPRGSKSVGPLLPPEDQALAKERAGKPAFAGVFADHLQRLTPSLGESEARTRALARTIRAYRGYHECDFKTAKTAVLTLLEPPAEQQQIAIEQASGPEPTSPLLPVDQQLIAVEPDLGAEYEKRFKLIVPNVGPDEGRLRAFEHTVGVCRNHYRVGLETARKMTADAIKAARAK